jgi:pimeloyl-ACP methyl ester carboxylesterase
MSSIDIKGKKVHYIEMNPKGEEAIILIHGLFTNLAVYFYYIAPRLAKRHRVILYDLRSHGLSERRDEGYTLEILLDDLMHLMDALEIRRAHFVGYSYGGAIALFAAIRHPERVARLALIEATLMNERIGGQLISEDMPESLLRSGLEKYAASTGLSMSGARADQILEQSRCLFENGLLSAAFRDGSARMAEAPLEQLTHPVLLLYGNRSEHSVSGRTLKRRIPRAKLFFGRGDHNLPVQKAPWIHRRLRIFFR